MRAARVVSAVVVSAFAAVFAVALSLVAVCAASAAPARAAAPGLSVVSVRVAFPSKQRDGNVLSPSKLNVVFTSGVVSFEVAVRNGGGSPARRVSVRLTIERGAQGAAIVKTETVASLAAGQTQTVAFNRVAKVPLAEQTKLVISAGGASTVEPIVFALTD